MTRNYKYIVEIQLSGNSNKIKFEEHINYLSGGEYKDLLCINNNSIIIEAYRSSSINLNNIFYNNTSSIYFQIIKSLVFYYCVTPKFTKINNIIIKRFGKRNTELNSIEIKTSEINQIIAKGSLLNYKFKPNVITPLFGENKLGKSLLIATSYILKANNAKDESDRFNYLWRAFNSIYSLSEKKFEWEKLNVIVAFIINKSKLLPLAIKMAKTVTNKRLGDSIRMRAYILSSNKKHIVKTLAQYKDKRINNIFKERLSNNSFKYINEKTHKVVNKHLTENNKNNDDAEMICFLCCKYMYFVRNKLFHGERLDASYRLTENKELEELIFLSDMLESLLVDLINHNSEYQRFLKI